MKYIGALIVSGFAIPFSLSPLYSQPTFEMLMKDLPAEILLEIFKLSTRRDLMTYFVVSEKWQSAAAQVYYKELELRALNIHKLKSILSSLNNSSTNKQPNYFHYCEYTEKLKIESDSHGDLRMKLDFGKSRSAEKSTIAADASKLTTEEFKSFLSYLSKLRWIDFGKSDNFKFYMECLRDLDNTQYLQHIEKNSIGDKF